jgi:hypothetical protein
MYSAEKEENTEKTENTVNAEKTENVTEGRYFLSLLIII